MIVEYETRDYSWKNFTRTLSMDWNKLSLAEQLGNVGSEVSRIRHWDKQGAEAEKEQAFLRALELIDLTLADPRWKGRVKEIVRLREILADYVTGSQLYNISLQDIEDYLLSFALRARS